MQRTINREMYLNWLLKWRGQQIIKVISGVRRCGKSTLFAIYRDYLQKEGIAAEQIISLNFEDIEYEELCDYRKLYSYISQRLLPEKMNYIFLDEVQHVECFEKAVDSLFLKDNCDVYITGSNAYFLSGELATQLSGRYVELKMLPLSFKEFAEGLSEKGLSDTAKFERYLRCGSFPYVLRFDLAEQEAREYMRDIYSTVLLKDIVSRLKVSDVNILENVTKFMFHNIGNLTSPGKIANTLKSAGTKVDQRTVDKYLRGLTDSLLLYSVSRYNVKGRQLLATQGKFYAVDTALRNILVRGKESDIGHILENIVFLELYRRGFSVFVGQMEHGEIDFVAVKDGETAYYQVSASVLDPSTLKRELAPLQALKDNYPKYLLTLDEVFRDADYEGIRKVNLLDWLLEKR